MNDKERLLSEMDRCVVEMEDEEIVNVAKEYVDAGYDAYEGITEGLSKGMEKAGELYEEEEYFVPELLICSDARSSNHISREREQTIKFRSSSV